MPAPLRRNRDFLLLNAGQLLSSAGSAFSSLAYPLLVLGLTGSATKTGVVAFARLLPAPLFGLAAGIVADRFDRKRIMLAADGVRALAVGGVALVVIVAPTYWPIPLLAFVEGLGDTFFATAQPGAIRAVVATEQLPAAVGVQEGRSAAVRLAAPPLGGVLYGVGRAIPFLADAVSYALSFASLLAIRRPFQRPRPRGRVPIRAYVAEGFAFLWRQPFVRATSFLYAVGNFTIPGILLVLVVVARRDGLTSAAIGVLLATFSAAILVGATISPLVRRRLTARAVLLLEFTAGLAVGLFVVWPSPYVLAAALLPQAVCLPISDSLVHGYRIALIPDALLGRVESVRSTIARIAQPLGPLLAGLLLDGFSARVAVGVFLLCSLGLAICGWLTPALRDLPELAELDPG